MGHGDAQLKPTSRTRAWDRQLVYSEIRPSHLGDAQVQPFPPINLTNHHLPLPALRGTPTNVPNLKPVKEKESVRMHQ